MIQKLVFFFFSVSSGAPSPLVLDELHVFCDELFRVFVQEEHECTGNVSDADNQRYRCESTQERELF